MYYIHSYNTFAFAYNTICINFHLKERQNKTTSINLIAFLTKSSSSLLSSFVINGTYAGMSSFVLVLTLCSELIMKWCPCMLCKLITHHELMGRRQRRQPVNSTSRHGSLQSCDRKPSLVDRTAACRSGGIGALPVASWAAVENFSAVEKGGESRTATRQACEAYLCGVKGCTGREGIEA